MATIIETNGKFKVQIRRQGVRKFRTFARRAEALRWAKEAEREILLERQTNYSDMTLAEAFDCFTARECPRRKGAAREITILRKFRRDNPRLVLQPLAKITKGDVASWRDRRLTEVSPPSVRREWILLSSLYNIASRDWGLELPPNPFCQVRKPASGKPRCQRITPAQSQMFLEALDYRGQVLQARQKVAWAFLFALETACRRSEILALQPEDVQGDAILLRDTKNGDSRLVPLSPEAKRLLDLVSLPLGLTPAAFNALFRRHRPVELAHIHFHDTRHEALSRMALKINNPMTLAKISGHRDLKILLNTYYNPNGADLIGLLD